MAEVAHTVGETERIIALSAIEEHLHRRADGIDDWLREIGSPCKVEQRHCEEGTVEHEYWHYSYMVALRDVLDLLKSLSLSVY